MYRKQVRRRRAVLALLIIGSFALLTLTVGGESGVQRTISAAFTPVQGVADRALKPARDLVNWFDQTFEARGENERLREQLAAAREDAVAGKVALSENAELRKLLRLDRTEVLTVSAYKPVTGRVIARSPTFWYARVTIDLGKRDGVRVDDPVVADGSLAGRITSVAGGSSQVTLLTDHASRVTARVVPRGVAGVIGPEVGDPEELVLDFIDSSAPIGRGDVVVTAGWRLPDYESLFPPGLPIGEVTSAPLREREASQRVHVRPYADMRNLEFVQVLTGGSRG